METRRGSIAKVGELPVIALGDDASARLGDVGRTSRKQ